jgi:hypothetical protein
MLTAKVGCCYEALARSVRHCGSAAVAATDTAVLMLLLVAEHVESMNQATANKFTILI